LREVNPTYARVLRDYERDVQPLEDLLGSAVGVLANSRDTQLVTQLKGILSPGTKSPDAVRRIRQALSSQDVNAWNGVKRAFIQQLGDDALKMSERGEVLNPAGKLYKAFSNPNMRANLEAALTPLEFSNMQEMMLLYRDVSRVKPIGSDTAWNQLETQIARQTARPVVAKLIKGINPMELIRSADEFLTDRALRRNDLASLQHVISNDPQAVQAMRELRQLNPREWQYRALLGFIVSRGGPTAAATGASLISGSDAPDGEAEQSQ
jgi:hypothetical protein